MMNYKMKFTPLFRGFPLLAVAFSFSSLLADPLEGLSGTEIAAWSSAATGMALTRYEYVPPTAQTGKAQPTIVYLLNLTAPRVGTDSDEAIVADFLAEGYVVITVDYESNAAARSPSLNPDILKVRDEVLANKYVSTYTIDQTALFIVPSGHRVARDLMYETTGWTRGIDLIYPSNPAYPVGAMMEFSCDNGERMGNYSMYAIRDTLLEGMATEGFAVAMADHPMLYGDPDFIEMPASFRKVKAAVRTLRANAETYGLSGDIVTLGFSRASAMALFAATSFETDEFDGFYEHQGVDSSVQGAIILSGKYDYLDLLPDSKLQSKINSAPSTYTEEKLRAMSALSYLESPTPHPFYMALNASEVIDDGEKADPMHQMEVLMARFDELEIDYTFRIEEPAAGHKMPLDPDILNEIIAYLEAQLRPAPETVLGEMQLNLEGSTTETIRWHTVDPVPPNDYQLQTLGTTQWTTVTTLYPDAEGILSFDAAENEIYRIIVETEVSAGTDSAE